MSEIVNRVASSPVITLRLEEYYPQGNRVVVDIKGQLFQGMILRERDFRAWVKEHDWSQYQDMHVAITCSTDAIIQVWAYMLLTTHLQPVAQTIVFGTAGDLERHLWETAIAKIDWEQFRDRPVVLKGCSGIKVPDAMFVEATRQLLPRVKKLSYGEPCSTVPVYRRK